MFAFVRDVLVHIALWRPTVWGLENTSLGRCKIRISVVIERLYTETVEIIAPEMYSEQ